jgi:hypothetical protein
MSECVLESDKQNQQNVEQESDSGTVQLSTNNPVIAKSVPINTKNVHKLTTYELRQELVRRNKLDIPDDKINHNSMLQRLIQELVIDEANFAKERADVVVDKAQEERDAAKALREQRKAEALARSKARQSDPNYFKKREESNVEAVKVQQVKATELKEMNPDEIEVDEEPDEVDDDPFRTVKTKGRSKIAGFI